MGSLRGIIVRTEQRLHKAMLAAGGVDAQKRGSYSATRTRLDDAKRAATRPFRHVDWAPSGPRRQAFLIFSSILKRPFGAPTNIRLNVFGRQRRSSVLRRVRVRSAIFVTPYSWKVRESARKPAIIPCRDARSPPSGLITADRSSHR